MTLPIPYQNSGTGSDGYGPTPFRTTTLTLDVQERILQEVGIRHVRRGSQMASTVAEGVQPVQATTSIRYWSSGCYSLAPVQTDISSVSEEMAGASHILPASAFTLEQLGGSTMGGPVTAVVTQNKYAQTGLTGAGAGSGLTAAGDPFLVRQFPPGYSLDPSLVSANAALTPSTLPQVTLDGASTTTRMDRIALSTATYAEDQGWFLRWSCPGNWHNYPKYAWSFYFGQYAVTFTGDGKAILSEYCIPATGPNLWRKRAVFRYATSKQVMGTSHTLTIWPHVGPKNEQFVAFAGGQLDSAQPSNTGNATETRAISPQEFVYKASKTLRGTDADPCPGHSTAIGPVAVDCRSDLRMEFQVSKLAFQTSGLLTDFSASVGTLVGNTNPVTISMSKVVPASCALTAGVYDAQTNAAFVPGTNSQPFPIFSFSGDGTATPILYAYAINQKELVSTVTPGAFSLDLEAFTVTAFSGDPSEESADATAYDLLGVHTRMTKRGRLNSVLTVNDATYGSVAIFRGYCYRPRSVQVGPDGGVFGGWRHYYLSFQGAYLRLAERVAPSFAYFQVPDPAATPLADGTYPPYKVTDAIRTLLLSCGYDSAQVDIPDLPYRLWPGHDFNANEGNIQPGADIAEVILRLCRNYLGCYLYFNPVSGSMGKWQLLFGTPLNSGGGFTPLYNFVTTPPSGHIVPTQPGAYAANTTFIDGPVEITVNPPDFNMVVVSTDGALTTENTRLRTVAYCYNFLSFQVPGSTVTPDPNSPDYIGHCVPYEIFDPTLVDSASDANTWAAVAWTARRAYDFYCHGQRIAHFSAPLVFVYDSGLGVNRTLRFQDPIAIDGDSSWLIKSMVIRCTKSNVMMCDYECIQPVAGQYFFGADGIHHHKEAIKTLARKHTGHTTRSNHWGLLSVSPADELRRLSLPMNNVYQVPLQDPTGTFYGMPGWNTQTGATG